MLKNTKTVLTLAVFALMIGGFLFWKSGVTSGNSDQTEFNQKVSNALAEINFAHSADALAVRTATDDLTNFIQYRSGVQLNQANKDSLQQSEESALNQSKRITPAQLAQILTDVSFERLAVLSDADIAEMAETLRGFDPPGGLPASFQTFRNKVKPRANGDGAVQPEKFIDQLKASRDALIVDPSSKEVEMTRTALRNRITYEISNRVNYIAEAEPDFFGGTKGNMTPIQAFLITYSIISDDLLAGNQGQLEQKKNRLQQLVARYGSESYPDPQGFNGYGANGYIYSSPVGFLLDDATTSRILNLIRQQGGLQ